MKLGREIVRACVAGTVMHFVIVAACSAGGDGGGPGLRLQSGDAGGLAPTGVTTPGSSGKAAVSMVDASISTMLDNMMSVPDAHAAESGTRLKARWYVGSDGSRQFINWHDSSLDADCYFAAQADGVLRCVPSYTYASRLFTDAACTQPVAYYSGCNILAGDTVAILYTLYDNVCGAPAARGEAHYHTAGATIQPAQVWNTGATGCVQYTTPPAGTYYRLGAEIALSSFVAAQVEVAP